MFKRGLDSMGKGGQRADNSNRVFDFWLDYESRAEIVFLDSFENAPYDTVHPLFFDKMQHLVGCERSRGGSCMICEFIESLPKGTKDVPYARDMAFFSVLDLRPYEKEDGTVIPATKKLLKATKATCKLIKREMEEAGIEDLYGTLWRVSRGEDAMPKPAAVGDRYRYEKKANLQQIIEDMGDENIVKPFDLEVLNEMVIRDPEKIAEVFQGWQATKTFSAEKKSTGFAGAKLRV